jgi:hypothetical protein
MIQITINPTTIVGILLIALAASAVWNITNIGLDDSDKNSRNRSGVAVSTDHKTGLQYLLTPGGGITPRLDVDGRHMRAHPEKPYG